MKPSPIIQLITIGFGMFAIYTSMSYLLSTGIFSIAGMFEKESYYGNAVSMYMLVVMIGMAFLGLFLIFKSKDISTFVTDKSGYSGELTIKMSTKDLLCIMIIFLALSELVKYLPSILNDLLGILVSNGKGDLLDGNDNKNSFAWMESFFHFLFPVLMIVFCRNLANYFSKNVDMEANFNMQEPEPFDLTKKEN